MEKKISIEELNQIEEINKHIKDGVRQWSEICLQADADQWSYFLDYDENDLMNVSFLFDHICMNIGIKGGVINESNAEKFGDRFRKLIIDMTGIDPHSVFDGSN